MWRKHIKSVGNMFKKRTRDRVVNNLCKQFILYPQINNKQENIIWTNIRELNSIHIFTPLILIINLYI